MQRVLIAATIIGLSAAALAAEPVILAGEIVCRLADPGEYGSVSHRVAAVDKRICDAISYEDVGNPQMKVAKRNGRWAVYIGRTYLVSVYPLDAKHYNLPEQQVAQMWASRFKKLFPLSQPVTKMKHRPGTLPPQEAAKHERVPVGAPVSVPPEHWGLMNRWLLLLWKARSMPQAEFDEQRSRLEAEIIETAARHYFAEPEPCDCHEPGTCPSLSTCQRCQQAMSAAVELPRDKRPDSQRLLLALAGDEPARLNIRRAFDYVRQIEQSRFIRERVRLAWSLWEKLRSRGRLLLAQAIQAQEGDAR